MNLEVERYEGELRELREQVDVFYEISHMVQASYLCQCPSM